MNWKYIGNFEDNIRNEKTREWLILKICYSTYICNLSSRVSIHKNFDDYLRYKKKCSCYTTECNHTYMSHVRLQIVLHASILNFDLFKVYMYVWRIMNALQCFKKHKCSRKIFVIRL
jgi:hypothetical protein